MEATITTQVEIISQEITKIQEKTINQEIPFTDKEIFVTIKSGIGTDATLFPIYYQLEQQWQSMGINAYFEKRANVESFRSMGDNRPSIKILAMHGINNPFRIVENGQVVIKNKVGIVLNETPTDENMKSYKEYLADGSIEISLWADSPGMQKVTYMLYSDFMLNHGKRLDNTVIYAHSCNFYGSDGIETSFNLDWANVLLHLGAKTVIGYRNSVHKDYTNNIMQEIVEQIFKNASTKEAFDAAREKYGYIDEATASELLAGTPHLSGDEDYVMRPKSQVRGKVVFGTQASEIKNVKVIVADETGKIVEQTSTDSYGNYKLYVNPGRYTILIIGVGTRAYLDVFEAKEYEVTMMPKVNLVTNDNSYAGYTYKGRVRENGNPSLAGIYEVTINVRKGYNNKDGEIVYTFETDEQGFFNVKGLSGYYTLELVKDGYEPLYQNIILGVNNNFISNLYITPTKE